MPLNDTILNVAAQAMMDAAGFAAIHTAQPDATGSNQSTAGRQEIDWVAASGGDMILSTNENFTGGAASGPATHVGLWSAATGGTFYGWFAVTGDQTFNAAGEYTLTSITISGSSAAA